MAVEKIRTRGGALHRFRPLPAENVYKINKHASKDQIDSQIKAINSKYILESDKEIRNEQQLNTPDIERYKSLLILSLNLA
jgi:hypothetical protein